MGVYSVSIVATDAPMPKQGWLDINYIRLVPYWNISYREWYWNIWKHVLKKKQLLSCLRVNLCRYWTLYDDMTPSVFCEHVQLIPACHTALYSILSIRDTHIYAWHGSDYEYSWRICLINQGWIYVPEESIYVIEGISVKWLPLVTCHNWEQWTNLTNPIIHYINIPQCTILL